MTVIGREPDLAESRLSAFLSHVRAVLEDETAAAYRDGYARGYAACSTDAHVTERAVRAFADVVPGPELSDRTE